MHTARFGERLPRLQIQFRISRSFRPRNLANLGSKISFWIRRKEHTLSRGVPWNYFESTRIIDVFDAQPPVRQQFVCHHRKEDHAQFSSLGHSSDRVLPILTACFRDVKNAAIQDKRTG